jgi:hypothetical protein
MVGSCPGTLASSTTKTGRHDIAESGVKTPKTWTFGPGELIIRWQNFQIKFTIPTDQLMKLTTH